MRKMSEMRGASVAPVSTPKAEARGGNVKTAPSKGTPGKSHPADMSGAFGGQGGGGNSLKQAVNHLRSMHPKVGM
jgi:hypothetical protein